MKLTTIARGTQFPPAQERRLVLRALPSDIRILSAFATVTPVAAPGATPLMEEIDLAVASLQGSATWSRAGSGADSWIEIDVFRRRTFVAVQGSGGTTPTLQVDMGGAFVNLADDGSFFSGRGSLFSVPLNGSRVDVPSVAAQRLRLVRAGTGSLERLWLRAVPKMVRLALGNQGSFWTHTEELTGSARTHDFGSLLSAFLAEQSQQASGIAIPFDLSADLPTRFDLRLDIEYECLTKVLPPQLEEATLAFDHGGQPLLAAEPLAVVLPDDAIVRPEGTAVGLLGGFEESRIMRGPIGHVDNPGSLALKPGTGMAQPIDFEEETPFLALDLLLASATPRADLEVNIMPNSDGKPFGQPLLSEPLRLELNREQHGNLSWIYLPLAREFIAATKTTYWLTVQVLEGEAVWGVGETGDNADLPSAQVSDSGGLAWRQARTEAGDEAVAGLWRLRNQPTAFRMPIHLKVGTGAKAERIGFEAYNALGRVDFRFDLDDQARAINRYLDESIGEQARAEWLRNGTFANWRDATEDAYRRHGFSLRPAEGRSRAPTAMAIPPYGQVAFLALRMPAVEPPPAPFVTGSTAILRRLDLACNKIEDRYLSRANPRFTAVANRGSQVAVVSRTGLAPDDRYHLHLLPAGGLGPELVFRFRLSNEDLDWRVNALTAHPDRNQLFLAVQPLGSVGQNELWVLDTELVMAQPPTAGEDRLPREAVTRLPLDESSFGTVFGINVTHLTVAGTTVEGGFQLLAGISGTQPTLASFRLEGSALVPNGPRLPLPGRLRSLTVCRRSDRILATTFMELTHHLLVYEIRDRRLQQIRGHAPKFPSGPERVWPLAGDRGLVSYRARPYVQEIDLISGDLGEPRAITNEPFFRLVASQLSPDGALLQLAGSTTEADFETERDNRFIALSLAEPAPEVWQLSHGFARPFRPQPAQETGILLGALPRTGTPAVSAISQVIRVQPELSLHFSFAAHACEQGAMAEIGWHDDQCKPLSWARFPIDPPAPNQTGTELGEESSSLLYTHSYQVQTPANATRAEVRFTVPSGQNLTLADVALSTGHGRLASERLELDDQNLPRNWSIEPDAKAGFQAELAGLGVRIQNLGRHELRLKQRVKPEPNKDFQLLLNGGLRAPPAGEVTPSIRLVWLNKEGVSIRPDSSPNLVVGAFDQHQLAGVAPEDADQLDVTLVLPPGQDVQVNRIRFHQPQRLHVPLTFLAESPGELQLRQWVVAYDRGSPRVDRVDEVPACPVSLPPGVSDEPCDYDCCAPCSPETGAEQPPPSLTPPPQDPLTPVDPPVTRPPVLVDPPTGTPILEPIDTPLVTVDPVLVDPAVTTPIPTPEVVSVETEVAPAMPSANEESVLFEPGEPIEEAPLTRVTHQLAELLADPELAGLQAFKLATVLQWSTQRLAAHLTREVVDG